MDQGFNYAFLLVASVINAAWLTGTYLLWLDAERNSTLLKQSREAGLWRSILDLADATELGLGAGRETSVLNEMSILRRLKGLGRGARIGYEIEGGGVGGEPMGEVRLRRRRGNQVRSEGKAIELREIKSSRWTWKREGA